MSNPSVRSTVVRRQSQRTKVTAHVAGGNFGAIGADVQEALEALEVGD